MNKEKLKEIILDQIDIYLHQEYVKREYDLDINTNYCFVGIRRCGKSYLMYQMAHELIQSGIKDNQIIYVNFEDERLLEFNASDFNAVLEIAIELAGNSGQPYIFLDELQNIEGWEKFARRLADMKYHSNITGSNSKMLSSEIASTLGGRFIVVDVYPYSFMEYLRANGLSDIKLNTRTIAQISGYFNQYLTYGAFPELVGIANKKAYLNNIYQTVYLGDIASRNKVDNLFALRLIVRKLSESVMKPISFSRLFGIVKSAGAALGKQTVINYVGYALDSLLIFEIENYAAKLVDKETSPKYYFADQGLFGILESGDNSSKQLENLAALELIRRYGKNAVYYFERNTEVDFYIPDDNLAIQVCYDLRSKDETYRREIEALIKLKSHFKDAHCLILTMSEEDNLNIDGVEINVMPMWKWLLNI